MSFRDLAQAVIGQFDKTMGEAATYSAWQPGSSTFAADLPITTRPITRDQVIAAYGGGRITGEMVFRVSAAQVATPEAKSKITHRSIVYIVTSFDRADPLGLDWIIGCRKAPT